MITRRQFVVKGGSVIGAIVLGSSNTSTDPTLYLQPTRYIDSDSPEIRNLALSLTRSASTDIARATAIFTYVRDEILFGFARGFWDMSASEVLRVRRGYCNTKSTLFVALLRAAGVPARQIFVDIDARILSGLIDPGTPYVDHSYVEIFLMGAWRPTDAYIVDPALFGAAQKRLRQSGDLLGFGVHITGSNVWNGLNPSYSQFNINDPRPITSRNWGVFADVGDFYARAEHPWNRLNTFLRSAFGLMASDANQRAEALRRNLG